MHWPVAFAKGKTSDGKPNIDWELTNDLLPTWRAMEALVEKGKVREIGVSNVDISRMKKLLAGAKIKPVVNQVELNLRCAQPELVAVSLSAVVTVDQTLTPSLAQWSAANGILLESYSPLGSTGAPQLDDNVVKSIADAHKVDPANVLISWQVQRGLVCLPKSVTASRIKSNFEGLLPVTSSHTLLNVADVTIALRRRAHQRGGCEA